MTDPHLLITAFREKTLRTVREHGLFTREDALFTPEHGLFTREESPPPTPEAERGQPVVVGVSGGADSLALLYVLASLAKPLGLRIVAATLDHGLRGEAGAEDVRFVSKCAERLGVPCAAGFADVRAEADQLRLSTETAARRARYRFFAETAAAHGARWVAVGHHAGDQAETVLMRLLRGTGTAGLAAMRAQGDFPGEPMLRLARPLLRHTRAETEAYCAALGLVPRHDATNDMHDALRNRIRLDLLPMLRAYNLQVERTLARVADNAAEDEALLTLLAARAIAWEETDDPRTLATDRAAFVRENQALQRRALQAGFSLLAGAAHDLDHAHLRAALTLARTGRPGAIALFSHGRTLRIAHARLFISAPRPTT
jgi:tRNA(Ile)-lysidine synthase